MKKIFPIIILLFFCLSVASAQKGCCSHHDGVCGCNCCDGTSLSSTCQKYYPKCSSSYVNEETYMKNNNLQEESMTIENNEEGNSHDMLCIKLKGEDETQCASNFQNFDINKNKEKLERCYFEDYVESDTFGLDYTEVNCFDDIPGKEETIESVPCHSTYGCPELCQSQEGEDSNGCPTMNCTCPPNHGFCGSTGLRDSINNTNTYCFGGLLFEQKQDNQTCQNSFECVSNFCGKGLCYDISAQVEENKSILQSILNWIKMRFHIS